MPKAKPSQSGTTRGGIRYTPDNPPPPTKLPPPKRTRSTTPPPEKEPETE